MTRWAFLIEYDGTDFCGWQRQEDGVPSVQATMEGAIKNFCGQDVTLHVAGRTDAGVHARGQVAHTDMDVADRYTGYHVVKAINAHIRDHKIAVVAAQKVPDDFHARFSAVHKRYEYQVLARVAPGVLDYAHAWRVHEDLDIVAMQAGAQHLLGHHDFSSFRDADCQAKSPLKTLDRLDMVVTRSDMAGGRLVTVVAEARSFLHHQVRNMVGTLVQVGLGRFTPDDVAGILAARDRRAAGVTAPASGLTLAHIDYPPVYRLFAE